MLGREVMEFTHIHELDLHYQPGYMSEDVYFGFGHYLRRVKLPGYLSRDELRHGFDVVFLGDSSDDLMLECEIIYGCDGDGVESLLGKNFAKSDDIELFDIGGSAISRYVQEQMKNGRWHAEAEIYIKDEIYRFAAAAGTYDKIRLFHDALRGALNVEDWYDEAIKEDIPDPHANGATFCTNGLPDTAGEYTDGFPYKLGFFDWPALITDAASGTAETAEEAVKTMMEMFEKLISDDTEESKNGDAE